MKILAVHGFPGSSAAAQRHYQFWLRSGWEIIGIGTEDEPCEWPIGMPSTRIGINSYINGPVLPKRMLDTFEFLYTKLDRCPEFVGIIEYDTICLRPIPDLPMGLTTHLAGGNIEGLKGNQFYHNPWLCDLATAELIVAAGREMLAEGDDNGGSPDLFIGWLTEKYNIPVNLDPIKCFSQNTIHVDWQVDLAREAVQKGAHFIHGIKDADILKRILS